MIHRPLRLLLDSEALVRNWRWLARAAGATAGAAVKADGYGLGARAVVERLGEAGCRDFFVSTWAEAAALGPLPGAARVAVLHGLGPDDVAAARALDARPVLNSPAQIARWKEVAPERPCDVMVDTGINRLGLSLDQLDAARGLVIDTLHSHLANGDEDDGVNARQRARFVAAAERLPARRRSLANSAGCCLGPGFGFDLVRPGLALYGGLPRREADGRIAPVVRLEAQIVQRRTVRAGEGVGYGGDYVAPHDVEAAVLNIGYADGYWRGFAGRGAASVGGLPLPLVGRVSMDLVTIDVSAAPDLREGDWVALDFALPEAAQASGMSQYELLTGLGARFERRWS